jgi:hypothetical protein
MSVVQILTSPHEHRLRQRLRDLTALQARVDAEVAAVRAALLKHGDEQRARRSRYQRPECATESGYQWHRHQARKGIEGAVWPLPQDDPCGCRAAHRAASREATRERRAMLREAS